MRAEDTQRCVERNIEAEGLELPDEIYLIPEDDSEFGQYWAWCDEPAPTNDHIPEEVIKYIKESAYIAEQAKCLKFAHTTSKMQKIIDRLELNESTKRQFDEESG